MITVSVVSHNHGIMVQSLLEQLLFFPEVSSIIVTLNIPETADFTLPNSKKIILINNVAPKGFSENHNNAFKFCKSKYFCVLNPDVIFTNNPFPILLSTFISSKVGVVSPLVLSPIGSVEDNHRYFPTFIRLFLKIFFNIKSVYPYNPKDIIVNPDWIAGMFMLFECNKYQFISGFDQRFYLYYEDVDLCKRLKYHNLNTVLRTDVSIIHNARRGSHRNLHLFFLHLKSMIFYFYLHYFKKYSK